MLKDIASIVGSRYLVAFLNLALIFINAKVLGIEGVGTIGLIWASINIIVVVNSVLSGSTLVYFVHKYPIRSLFPIAYSWIFVGTGIGCAVMQGLGMLPDGYLADIYLITVIYSIGITNSRFLLAKDHIDGFNLTNILQGGLLFFVLLFLYYTLGKREVSSYISGLYVTHIAASLVSMTLLFRLLAGKKEKSGLPAGKSRFSVLKEMFVYGLWGGADNIAETCTARLNYFFVERFAGISGVGLLDVGTKVSESVLYISRSIAYVAYNRVAKNPDPAEQKRVTLRLFKLSFFVALLVMGSILLIPEWVYTDYLFSTDFVGVRRVIAALSVSVVMLGGHTILSHYFVGSGKIRYSTYSSSIGLALLLIVGYFLIPAYGVVGAAISTSIAFSGVLLFSLTIFSYQTKSTFKDFLPNREDMDSIRKLFTKPR